LLRQRYNVAQVFLKSSEQFEFEAPGQSQIKGRERESLLAQTLNNIMQRRWDTEKKPAKQVVSLGAPRKFHKFLSWFKVDVKG